MNGIYLILLSSLVFLNGCVALPMPVPAKSHDGEVGRALSKEDVHFIVEGQTHMSEVILNLGSEYRASIRQPVIAYSWERPKVGWGFLVLNIGGFGGICAEGQDNSWRALFIKYDDFGHVVKTHFARLNNSKSLDEQMDYWAAGEGGHFLSEGLGVFNPQTGRPKMAEWARNNYYPFPVPTDR